MKQRVTRGIILSRTNYGEADRILTLLTPDYGKLRLIARGVRKAKSKLAGGIELFSVSDITFIQGRGEIGTLISTRLLKHYGRVVAEIDRVQLGYELIKKLHRVTEDQPEAEYFTLLEEAFQALDKPDVGSDLIRLWFESSLLRLAGHAPNLRTDTTHQKLSPDQTYNFDLDAMAFAPHETGNFTAGHIKALRLLFSGHPPQELQKVQGIEALLPDLQPLVRTMLTSFIRV